MVLCIPNTKETATPGVPASEEGVGAGVLGLAAPGGSEAEGEAPPRYSPPVHLERGLPIWARFKRNLPGTIAAGKNIRQILKMVVLKKILKKL